MASQRQTQSKTQVRYNPPDSLPVQPPFIPLIPVLPVQSFKRKPGQADNERTTGDYSKPINKRLRTVERCEDLSEDGRQSDAQQESDLYEHIKHGETASDTQTYGQ